MPPKKPRIEESRGLQTEIHPLLRDIVAVPAAQNPLKNTRRTFDPKALNPYLDQRTIGKGRRHKPFQLNEQGKYIEKGNALRARVAQEDAEAARKRDAAARGLLPDEAKGEHLYKEPQPPAVEWWDRPYLSLRLYSTDKDFILDDEDAPVTLYIQHPVPIPPPEQRTHATQRLFLTKKERKRMRRNERHLKHQEKQDRIKLGLDPPPPPKVKLSNLMNVLTNEAIQDPTGVEMRVRKEIDERFAKHMEENEKRKLTKEERHEKTREKQERDHFKGAYLTVYRVLSLADPQHFFKVDKNGKDVGLKGAVVIHPKLCLVVAEGGAKATKFYKRLMTHRIKWGEVECKVLWEGQLPEPSYRYWSVKRVEDEELHEVLEKLHLGQFWRLALLVG